MDRQDQMTGSEADQERLTLEQMFAKLDELIRMLESRETSLEDSFRIYQEGMRLIQRGSKIIEHVESQVMVMNENGGLDVF